MMEDQDLKQEFKLESELIISEDNEEYSAGLYQANGHQFSIVSLASPEKQNSITQLEKNNLNVMECSSLGIGPSTAENTFQPKFQIKVEKTEDEATGSMDCGQQLNPNPVRSEIMSALHEEQVGIKLEPEFSEGNFVNTHFYLDSTKISGNMKNIVSLQEEEDPLKLEPANSVETFVNSFQGDGSQNSVVVLMPSSSKQISSFKPSQIQENLTFSMKEYSASKFKEAFALQNGLKMVKKSYVLINLNDSAKNSTNGQSNGKDCTLVSVSKKDLTPTANQPDSFSYSGSKSSEKDMPPFVSCSQNSKRSQHIGQDSKVHSKSHSTELQPKQIIKGPLPFMLLKKLFFRKKCPARVKKSCELLANRNLSSEGPFHCKQCPSKFYQKSGLTNHVRIHSGEKPFACEQCSARFTQKSTLHGHLSAHSGEKPFSCEQCSARFSLKSDLNLHLRTHSGEKPYSCEQCSVRFTQKSALHRHLRIHSGEKPFSCEHCLARFALKGNLNVHLRRHSGEKPFSCEHCSARFTMKGNLNAHLRRHSGEKPFSCEHCSARFTLKGNLNVHLRRHSGEKPFSCEQCPAQFAQKVTLRRHLDIHNAGT